MRRARTPSGRWFTLTDTVGFVRHLPHQLVEAFRSTLEEVAQADLDPARGGRQRRRPGRRRCRPVREVLAEIGAADVPEIVVINKADAADPVVVKGLEAKRAGLRGGLRPDRAGDRGPARRRGRQAARRDQEVRVLVPYERGDLVARAHQEGEVLAVRHAADGTELTARVPPGLAAELTGVAGTPVAAAGNAIDYARNRHYRRP